MSRRPNWRPGFWERFAFYGEGVKKPDGKRPVLWLHAVSVGEVGICAQLIRSLEPRLPGYEFLVSTTTSTGMGELQRKLPPHIARIYYPVDFPGAVRRALDTFRPSAIVLVENELWPNCLWQATDRKIPLFLVNARISDRSFPRYRRGNFLFRKMFSQFRTVGCQEAGDAGRLAQLGFPTEAIRVVGSLKFDAAQPDARPGLDARALLRQIGVNKNSKILVAGSTHAGEEAVLAAMLKRLRVRFPELFLVLVPRHSERTAEVSQQLQTHGVRFIRRSEIDAAKANSPGDLECLLVNTTGELKFFYELADVVFVGKSLTAKGGQNPIEPAALGKAVVFGPNMQNFTSIVRAFLATQAVAQVEDAEELETAVAELLSDDHRRAELGARALAVVQKNLGATERTVELIIEKLQTRKEQMRGSK
ncbi:MAG TPA: 3-deoxy-D-manno-octulosonic acid transferase [Verrucomicrobiae bacterium]|nr:3-deoxy-D-manno-octulosonic acid transferase [Verrucomicrobiae bacterium]